MAFKLKCPGLVKTVPISTGLRVCTGKYIEVYSCYFELAKYFQLTGEGDKWLSDYFFDMALDTTKHMTHDDGRLAAEANCNVGLALKESSASLV